MTLAQRFKEMYRKYGRVAIIFHFSMYIVTYLSLYGLLKVGVDLKGILRKIGYSPKEVTEEIDAAVDGVLPDKKEVGPWRQRWNEWKKDENAQKMILAFALLKLTGPLRSLLTIGATPPIAHALRRRGWITLPKDV